MFEFHVDANDESSAARTGRWVTPHGVVDTPAFMPVGTRGSVKGVWPQQLAEVGTQIVLANTYHLALRPGENVVAELGGLHRFMNWDGPILTDSGGFQVFSLADLCALDDEQVVFRSHIDGSLLELSPERAIGIQEALGADCIMCLDECAPLPSDRAKLRAAVDRTTRWAARCRDAHRRADQALFGIVQGGIDPELRERSVAGLLPLDFPGYAIGGLSVGESRAEMFRTLDFTVPMLPADRPRYLMGVGRPIDVIEAVLRGVDLFDCVMPTRNARNAAAFTSLGTVKMRNLRHQRDESPLDPACDCPTCTQFSRAYLRHLFIAGEMLGPMALSVHNIAYYQRLLRELRSAIREDRAQEFSVPSPCRHFGRFLRYAAIQRTTHIGRTEPMPLADVASGRPPNAGSFPTLIDFRPLLSVLLAQAQDVPPAGGGQPTNPLFQMLLIFAPIVVLWYLLVLKPQNKEKSKRQDMLKSLKKNDPVVTIGGIIGTVVNVTEDGAEVTIRVDDNARLKLRRDAIREVVVKDKLDSK